MAFLKIEVIVLLIGVGLSIWAVYNTVAQESSDSKKLVTLVNDSVAEASRAAKSATLAADGNAQLMAEIDEALVKIESFESRLAAIEKSGTKLSVALDRTSRPLVVHLVNGPPAQKPKMRQPLNQPRMNQ